MRRLVSLFMMTVAFAGLATLPTLPAIGLYVVCMMTLFRVRGPLDRLEASPGLVRSRATH